MPDESENFNWYVAGYEGADGYWHDVVNGDLPPSDIDLQLGDEVVVSYGDADGVEHFITLYGGWEDYDSLEAAVDDARVQYGQD